MAREPTDGTSQSCRSIQEGGSRVHRSGSAKGGGRYGRGEGSAGGKRWVDTGHWTDWSETEEILEEEEIQDTHDITALGF